MDSKEGHPGRRFPTGVRTIDRYQRFRGKHFHQHILSQPVLYHYCIICRHINRHSGTRQKARRTNNEGPEFVTSWRPQTTFGYKDDFDLARHQQETRRRVGYLQSQHPVLCLIIISIILSMHVLYVIEAASVPV